MSDPLVDIQALRVRAGGRDVLFVERLTVDDGEVAGVVGPNGAGKSTLLRVVCGMQRASEGRIEVLGCRVDEMGSLRLTRLRRCIGYVPQGLAAHSEMPLTVREVVAIGRTGMRGFLRRLQADDWSIVDEWIERLGIADLAGRAYAELSGGEQRRTLIARAMVQQPRLLLLDEPAAHLDLGAREQIVRLMDQLHHETGVAVVVVCHALEVLPRSCDRVILLEQGRVTATGRREQVLCGERITRLYGAELSVAHRDGRTFVTPAPMRETDDA